MFLFNGSYLAILVVSLVLGFATQAFISSTYKRYSAVPLSTGKSGAEVARAMLDAEGLHDVRVEEIGGTLTDNYDPRDRVLRLSRGVYEGRSVAAAGVALHEAGHAVQHARAFAFASVRSALVPAANIGQQFAFPLIFFGIVLRGAAALSATLIWVGIALYGLAVAFQVVTLPVELDASRRAIGSLRGNMLVPPEQTDGARSVLTAAAFTYVAAALISVMYLLYFIGLGRRD